MLSHASIGPVVASQQRRLRDALMMGSAKADWSLRASCAIGALHLGLFSFEDADDQHEHEVVVGAALGALLSPDEVPPSMALAGTDG